MQHDNTLHLLIMDHSLNDAETIVSLLRNSGYAVRATRAEKASDVENAIIKKPFEVFLCADDMDDVSVDNAAELLRKSNKDIALIAIGQKSDTDKRLATMKAGAKDYVSKDDMDHLKMVVQREFQRMVDRRQFRKIEHILKETEKRCHHLLASSRDAIAYVADGMHVFANDSYLELFGYEDLDDIAGVPLLDMVPSEHQPKIKEFLRSLTSDSKSASIDVEIKTKRSTIESALEFSGANYDGEPCHQIVIRTNADAHDLEDKLTALKQRDLATGLLNRQHMFSVLNEDVLDNPQTANYGALMLISVDSYTRLKTTIGIASFDIVLSELGKVVNQQIPDNSLVARFDDNSITVLLPKLTADEAMKVAESIVTTVSQQVIDIQNQSTTITVSIGVSIIGDNFADAQMLVDQTILARDKVASDGGGSAMLSVIEKEHNDDNDGKVDDNAVVQNIIDGLAKHQFYLVYLPIANLHGDGGEKYEAFARLKDNDGNYVNPGTVFQVAHRNNLGKDIDRWIIREIVTVLAERKKQGTDTLGFIKITDETLADPSLLPWLAQLLKETKLPADHLVFELNESSISTNLKVAKSFADSLKQLHCSVLIDQFGSGTNSFQLLKHVPADYLKFDATFMHELASNPDNQAQMKEMVTTAHSMGKLCIAPNVEDAPSLAMLWQYELNYIQGFFLHEPTADMDFDFSEMIL